MQEQGDGLKINQGQQHCSPGTVPYAACFLSQHRPKLRTAFAAWVYPGYCDQSGPFPLGASVPSLVDVEYLAQNLAFSWYLFSGLSYRRWVTRNKNDAV